MYNIFIYIEDKIALILIIFLFLLIIFFVWNIIIQIQLSKFKKRNRELFSGNKIKNIEDFLLEQNKSLKLLDKDIQELYAISNGINNLAFRGFHKFAMIRFNPFKDVGGDQSFAIAILNGKNNGLIISSLYTREGTRVYSKLITEGESKKHPLTQEEKEALKEAMEKKVFKNKKN